MLSAAIAAGGAWVLAGPSAASDPCAPGVDCFASAWGDDAATAVRTAFLATGLPFAEPSFREVARQLDERHQAWTAMHRDSCLATRVPGEQSDAMLDLRAACLDCSLREVSAFVAQLRRVDRDGVRLAGQQVGLVGEVARCADVAALARRAPPPSTPDTRTRLTALSEALATVRARVLAGHHRDVAAECDALGADARALGYAPVLAEALILAASVQRETDHAARAEQLLEEAVVAADAGGDDDQRFESEVALIRVVGELLERGDDGARHAERADAIPCADSVARRGVAAWRWRAPPSRGSAGRTTRRRSPHRTRSRGSNRSTRTASSSRVRCTCARYQNEQHSTPSRSRPSERLLRWPNACSAPIIRWWPTC